MAGVKVLMNATGSRSLHQAHEKIHCITGAEAVLRKSTGSLIRRSDCWCTNILHLGDNFAALTVLLTVEEGFVVDSQNI